MNSIRIVRTSTGYNGFMLGFRVSGDVFGMDPATVHPWHSLRYRHRDDPRRHRARCFSTKNPDIFLLIHTYRRPRFSFCLH